MQVTLNVTDMVEARRLILGSQKSQEVRGTIFALIHALIKKGMKIDIDQLDVGNDIIEHEMMKDLMSSEDLEMEDGGNLELVTEKSTDMTGMHSPLKATQERRNMINEIYEGWCQVGGYLNLITMKKTFTALLITSCSKFLSTSSGFSKYAFRASSIC